MILAITGKPGAGKTYLATKLAIDALKRGTPVFANYHIFGARYIPSLVNSIKVEKGLIVMDELPVEAGARNIKYLPPVVSRQWSQHRHRGLDIIYTTQTLNRVDIIMRELTNEVLVCHSILDKLYWYGSYQPEEILNPMGNTQASSPLFQSFRALGFFSKKIYSLYSSKEEVLIPKALADRLARDWGQRAKDIVMNPLDLPICKEVEQLTLDFQKVAQDKARGEKFKLDLKNYLSSLLKVRAKNKKIKNKGIPF